MIFSVSNTHTSVELASTPSSSSLHNQTPIHPVSSHPILSNPVLSHPTPFHPIPPHLISFHPIPSHPTPPRLIPSHPIPSHFIPSRLIPSHPFPQLFVTDDWLELQDRICKVRSLLVARGIVKKPPANELGFLRSALSRSCRFFSLKFKNIKFNNNFE